MTINDLFTIEYGQKEYESKSGLDNGRVLLVSSSGEDNGCYGFFDIPIKYQAPFITVPRTGTIGQAFVQLWDCCANSDTLVLKPKADMSVENLFQVAYQIRKNKWRYQYGRKITPDRLIEQPVKITESKIKYKAYVDQLLPKNVKKLEITPNKDTRLIPLTDLCVIEKKQSLPQNRLEAGNTPYVTTTSKDNGISNFVEEDPNAKAKTLTVALNGSCGETFFQLTDYVTGGDNAVLSLKDTYNPYLLFFIAFQIKRQAWRYNYCLKLSISRLKTMLIPIPVKKGAVDFKYIELLVKNSYGFKELQSYL